MKQEHHERKVKNLEHSIGKLDLEQDFELVIEGYILIAAHFLNKTMHISGRLPEERGIKHNKLAGFIKNEKSFGEKSEEISFLMDTLENFRPSQVYGRGLNGKAAEKARECLEEIKGICKGIL